GGLARPGRRRRRVGGHGGAHAARHLGAGRASAPVAPGRGLRGRGLSLALRPLRGARRPPPLNIRSDQEDMTMADIREIRQEGPHHYVFSPYPDPIAHVDPGETVAMYTEDAFEGRITTEEDLPSKVLGSFLNPQTGPIYVNGAEPGDTLAVKIEAIE